MTPDLGRSALVCWAEISMMLLKAPRPQRNGVDNLSIVCFHGICPLKDLGILCEEYSRWLGMARGWRSHARISPDVLLRLRPMGRARRR